MYISAHHYFNVNGDKMDDLVSIANITRRLMLIDCISEHRCAQAL